MVNSVICPRKPGRKRRASQPASQRTPHQLTTLQGMDATSFLGLSPHDAVQALSLGNLVVGRTRTYGEETRGFFPITNRCYVGPHPVIIAILTAVLNQCRPWLAGLYAVPQITKSLFGHFRVTHDIVRLPQQLAQLEPADFDEIGIAIGNAPFYVSNGYQSLVAREYICILGNWQISTHCFHSCVSRD